MNVGYFVAVSAVHHKVASVIIQPPAIVAGQGFLETLRKHIPEGGDVLEELATIVIVRLAADSPLEMELTGAALYLASRQAFFLVKQEEGREAEMVPMLSARTIEEAIGFAEQDELVLKVRRGE